MYSKRLRTILDIKLAVERRTCMWCGLVHLGDRKPEWEQSVQRAGVREVRQA